MNPSTEENHNGSCTNNNQPVQACACCAALAQLRMPWMDAAIQHAAPHYPQAPYVQGPYAQNSYNAQPYYHQQAQPNPAAPNYEETAPVEKSNTLFFKLPGFGKSKKKTVPPKAKQARPSEKKAASTEDEDLDLDKSLGENASESAQADDGSNASENDTDWQDDTKAKKRKFKILFGLQGLAVSLFGIIMPTFILATSIMSTPKRITLVALHHPVETILEFLLVASIPVVNYLVWSAISKSRTTLSRWLVMALGASVGTGLVVSGICFAGLFGNKDGLADAIGSDFSMGFAWLSMLTFLSAAVSAYLANRLRLSWELQSSRLNVSIQAITGLILAVLTFAGSEYRPWCIRMAQFNAVSKDEVIHKQGLTWLRQINPDARCAWNAKIQERLA